MGREDGFVAYVALIITLAAAFLAAALLYSISHLAKSAGTVSAYEKAVAVCESAIEDISRDVKAALSGSALPGAWTPDARQKLLNNTYAPVGSWEEVVSDYDWKSEISGLKVYAHITRTVVKSVPTPDPSVFLRKFVYAIDIAAVDPRGKDRPTAWFTVTLVVEDIP